MPSRNRSSESNQTTWNYRTTMALINLYKKNEHLWCRESPLYRLSKQREITLEQIARKLNLSIKHVANKIHALRSNFNNILKKTKSSATQYTIKWHYYKHLEFLKKSFVTQDGRHTTDDELSTKNCSQNKNRHLSKRIKAPATPKPIDISPENTIESDHSEQVFYGFPSTSSNGTPTNRMEENDDNDESDIYIACDLKPLAGTPKMKTESSSSSSSTSTSINDDLTNVFFQTMAETVKMFPPICIAQIKINVSNMVGQMELELARDEELLVATT